MMRWSPLHGDMQGFQSKEVGIRPVKTCPDKISNVAEKDSEMSLKAIRCPPRQQ
jgi:hypothetical protein